MSRQTIYKVTAPSNIALLKYWGKRDSVRQWPANDSLSMTLQNCYTETTATLYDGPDHLFAFANIPTAANEQAKALAHLHNLGKLLNFSAPLTIQTRNTFPSDCGIASSASGMAALTIAAVAAWTTARNLEDLNNKGYTHERLAHLARLGSGSAGRSLFGGFVHWQAGNHPDEQRITQLHHAEHWQLCDLICVVSDVKKARSSREAHADAWNSPLFKPRLAEQPQRLTMIQQAIAAKDFAALGSLIEQEALDMHAVMMTSNNPVCYIHERTSELICWLRQQRQTTGLPAYFTLDAGPNLHVLCERRHVEVIKQRLVTNFADLQIIDDRVGMGPTLSYIET